MIAVPPTALPINTVANFAPDRKPSPLAADTVPAPTTAFAAIPIVTMVFAFAITPNAVPAIAAPFAAPVAVAIPHIPTDNYGFVASPSSKAISVVETNSYNFSPVSKSPMLYLYELLSN